MKNSKKLTLFTTMFITIFLVTNVSHVMTFYFDPGPGDPPPDDPPPPPPQDTTKPTVSITNPSIGDPLSGTVTIQASASDNVAVLVVTFSINGQSLGSDSSSPYQATLNTMNYREGFYTLEATAIDTSYNSKKHSINVQITRAKGLTIWEDNFEYAGDQAEGYDHLWTMKYNDWFDNDYHETYSDGFKGYVSETNGYASTNALVHTKFDMSKWTGEGDVTLEVKFKAQSNYYGGSSVTNFRIGIRRWGETTPLWEKSEVFRYSKDTGWKIYSYQITGYELLNYGGKYCLYWGYRDAWSTNWAQKVSIDYIQVFGDAFPGDTLQRKNGATLSKGIQDGFIFHQQADDDNPDSDHVFVSTATKIDGADSLGICNTQSPHIEAGIQVAMDYEEDSNYRFNLIDGIKIMIALQNMKDNTYVELNTYQKETWLNEEATVTGGTDVNYDAVWGTLAATGETLCAVGGVIAALLAIETIGAGAVLGAILAGIGGVLCAVSAIGSAITDAVAEGDQTIISMYTESEEVSPEITKHYAVSELDYKAVCAGTTDLRYLFGITPYLPDDSWYRVEVTYELRLKSCRYLRHTQHLWEPEPYTEYFDLFNMDNIRIVDTGCENIDEDIPVTFSAGSFLSYPTINGEGWYAVEVDNNGDIQISVPTSYSGFAFKRMEIRSWIPDTLQSNPVKFYLSTLTYTLLTTVFYNQIKQFYF